MLFRHVAFSTSDNELTKNSVFRNKEQWCLRVHSKWGKQVGLFRPSSLVNGFTKQSSVLTTQSKRALKTLSGKAKMLLTGIFYFPHNPSLNQVSSFLKHLFCSLQMLSFLTGLRFSDLVWRVKGLKPRSGWFYRHRHQISSESWWCENRISFFFHPWLCVNYVPSFSYRQNFRFGTIFRWQIKYGLTLMDFGC